MKAIFHITDYSGVPVTLGEREWKEKITSTAPTGHPEVADYLDDIRQTIADPDIVFESSVRADTRLFCRLNVGRGTFQGKHLTIVIKYVQESHGNHGYVSTAYLIRAFVTNRRVLWEKRDLLTS